MLKSRNKAFQMDVIAQNEAATAMLLAYFSTSSDAAIDVLKSMLPDKASSDALFEHFFNAVHPAIPILNRYAIIKKYDIFWMALQSHADFDAQFLPLLFAIFFSATLSICESSMFEVFGGEEPLTAHEIMLRQKAQDDLLKDHRALQNKYKIAVELSLAASQFPSQTSLQCLQASVIWHSCALAHASDHGTSSVAMLIRVAQLMGLHRDPSNFKDQFDIELAQSRRLLWWHLVYLDYIISMSQGLPPIVHRSENDVRLPSEYMIIDGIEYKDRIDPCIILANSISEASLLNCVILLAVYGVQRCGVNQIDKLDKEIINLKERMAIRWKHLDCLKDPNAPLKENVDPRQNVVAAWMYQFSHLVVEKAYTYLHHPNYLKDSSLNLHKGTDGEPSVRDRVIRSAINTINYFLGFARMPDFLIFMWYIRTIQPFHAILILLQDMYLNKPVLPEPGSYNIADERLLAVENVFKVLHFMKVMDTSEAVRSMWLAINKLRTGVWLKIGYLNPIGLPLVSSTLAPEYKNIATKMESSAKKPGKEAFSKYNDLQTIFAQAYLIANGGKNETEIIAPENSSVNSTDQALSEILKFSEYSFNETSNNVGPNQTPMSTLDEPIAEASNASFPSSTPYNSSSLHTTPETAIPSTSEPSVECFSAEPAMPFDQRSINLCDFSESLFDNDSLLQFAALMEDDRSWDNKWDTLLKEPLPSFIPSQEGSSHSFAKMQVPDLS